MYFITSIKKDDYRCVGYISNLDEAIHIVVNNIGDLNEAGYYPYIVIENIPEGIYKYDQNPMWFEYNEETNKYTKMNNTPSYINKHFVGFAIG